MKTPLFILAFVLCFVGIVSGQENDTLETYYDSISMLTDTVYENESDVAYDAPNDSTQIESRKFSDERLRRLKADADLNYTQPATVAESLWDRFWRWVGEMLNAIFDRATSTSWGTVIAYIVGLVVIVVIIMMVLKVDAFKIFYSGQGAAQKYQIVDENIHEMDFDQLLEDAMRAQDYRRGVRLLFLHALKLLADRQLIHWEMGKTNNDYRRELVKPELKGGFTDLSLYFEYAWYGNFVINRETFAKAQTVFSDWKTKLK